MTTLIILAMVFVFVGLRLWSVLGRRTGHEQPLSKPESVPTVRGTPLKLASSDAAPAPGVEPAANSSAASGLRAIAQVDPSFDAVRFVEGARGAYRMILEAYWKGDQDALAKMVDDEVAQAFAAGIAARAEAGEVLDNRLVSIETAQIEDARVEGQVAHIRLLFEADVAAVTRDREGNVIAGSLTDAIQSHDIWTFSRQIKSPDPNWTLTETDEVA